MDLKALYDDVRAVLDGAGHAQISYKLGLDIWNHRHGSPDVELYIYVAWPGSVPGGIYKAALPEGALAVLRAAIDGRAGLTEVPVVTVPTAEPEPVPVAIDADDIPF